MGQQQAVIAPTRYSLTHTRAVRTALSDGARIATMPGMRSRGRLLIFANVFFLQLISIMCFICIFRLLLDCI